MKHIQILLFALAVPMAGFFVAGCSGGDSNGGGDSTAAATRPADGAKPSMNPSDVADPKTINVNIGAVPFSMDPQLSTDIPGSKVLRHLHTGLTILDRNGQPGPGLAERWEHNEDFSVWTFHLRENAKWSNGEPLTAHDFLPSYERILDPNTAAQYSYNVRNFIKGGQAFFDARGEGELGVTAIDDHTLQIELEGPKEILDQLVAHPSWYPVYIPVIEENGEVWINNPETYIGSGPFRMAEIRSGDRFILEKNPHYFNADDVWFERAVFHMIEDGNTEIAAFERGELDLTEAVPLSELDELREKAEFYTSPWLGTYYLTFNLTRAPMNDVAMRRALSLSIPRTLITERVTGRGEVPATGFVPPGIPLADGTDFRELSRDFIDNSDQEANFEEARRILAEAGYGDGKPMPRIELLYNNEAEEHAKIAQLLQNVWRNELGLEANLKAVEFKVRQALGQNQDFDVMRAGWIGDYMDPITFMDILISESENNDGRMENERYDELIELARKEIDRRKAFEYMAEAEAILMDEEVAVAPIYYYADPIMARTDIVGWYRNALGDLDITYARRE